MLHWWVIHPLFCGRNSTGTSSGRSLAVINIHLNNLDPRLPPAARLIGAATELHRFPPLIYPSGNKTGNTRKKREIIASASALFNSNARFRPERAANTFLIFALLSAAVAAAATPCNSGKHYVWRAFHIRDVLSTAINKKKTHIFVFPGAFASPPLSRTVHRGRDEGAT